MVKIFEKIFYPAVTFCCFITYTLSETCQEFSMREKKERFMALYEPVHQSFERFCKVRAYGQMPFKDLMQETLLIAYSKLDQSQEADKFLFFLFGIATRVLANFRRKAKLMELDELPGSDHFQLPEATRRSEMDFLYKALSLLPADQRDALVFFEMVGFSVREIADHQKKSEEAIRQSLSRGRKKLLEILKNNAEYKNSMP
jgi:RNA polymerase sigma-70 factor (ECF subfamily)